MSVYIYRDKYVHTYIYIYMCITYIYIMCLKHSSGSQLIAIRVMAARGILQDHTAGYLEPGGKDQAPCLPRTGSPAVVMLRSWIQKAMT